MAEVLIPITDALFQGNPCPICRHHHHKREAVRARYHLREALKAGYIAYSYYQKQWIKTDQLAYSICQKLWVKSELLSAARDAYARGDLGTAAELYHELDEQQKRENR